ncbi:hypothetical protein [Sodalis-like endosymbiont of Proechinophthirus fluctus]|uniref:hypothetical protein n=1 Tax=Sodalis-like endosymbiont of Proechinophthirus fluctus TaxID=1462730 RepID=UPI001650A603|nr:hypothetical protein [Sodalis-like endosymbiont of Proechinophthirus fluctus]
MAELVIENLEIGAEAGRFGCRGKLALLPRWRPIKLFKEMGSAFVESLTESEIGSGSLSKAMQDSMVDKISTKYRKKVGEKT